ncbi:MAG: hypothetical protein K6C34_00625 [Alphaproteobacteria bacterium]|nr:hypothetical protein [Alphaproteobacteria bacterium]
MRVSKYLLAVGAAALFMGNISMVNGMEVATTGQNQDEGEIDQEQAWADWYEYYRATPQIFREEFSAAILYPDPATHPDLVYPNIELQDVRMTQEGALALAEALRDGGIETLSIHNFDHFDQGALNIIFGAVRESNVRFQHLEFLLDNGHNTEIRNDLINAVAGAIPHLSSIRLANVVTADNVQLLIDALNSVNGDKTIEVNVLGIGRAEANKMQRATEGRPSIHLGLAFIEQQ